MSTEQRAFFSTNDKNANATATFEPYEFWSQRNQETPVWANLAGLARGQVGGAADRATRPDTAKSVLPDVTFLKEQRDPVERANQIEKTAQKLADFISGAKESLHIAIYDFRLTGRAEELVVNALNDRAKHLKPGSVEIAFFQPEVHKTKDGQAAAEMTDDMKRLASRLDPGIKMQSVAENGDVDFQKGKKGALSSGVITEGIRGGGHLMHNKYVVRDAGTENAMVWTGSTNFTDDAFGDQDNNIVTVKSKDLAKYYDQDFSEMLNKHSIAGTGKNDTHTVKVGDGNITCSFSPGDGSVIDSSIADRIDHSRKVVHIASMDISSEKILQSISDAMDRGVKVDGIYDGPEMHNVVNAWEKAIARTGSPASQHKLDLWNKVHSNLVEKHSAPYSPKPGAKHNFMHNKVVSIDDSVVVTGSFNFSGNATKNAENVLIIENSETARLYSNYVGDLVSTYGSPRRKH